MPAGSIVEAELRTADISIQIVRHDWPSPVDATFSEADSDHVVAMQCQPPQIWSRGRFCGDSGERFGKIGRVLAIPAGMPLHVCASGGTVRAIRCAFSPETFQRLGGTAEWASRPVLDAALDIGNRRIADTLRRLGEEARMPGFASKLLGEALGATLMIDLSRHLEGARVTVARPLRGGLSQRQLKLITERVESDARPPTLDELARIARVSRRHLARAFRQTSGMSVHDYVERNRFRRAGEMLQHSDLMLKDIAFRLGFAHACSFSTAFRKLAGEPPLAYRRRVRS